MILFIITTVVIGGILIWHVFDLRERMQELEARVRYTELDINTIGRYVFEGTDDRPMTVTSGPLMSGWPSTTSPNSGGVTMVSEGGPLATGKPD